MEDQASTGRLFPSRVLGAVQLHLPRIHRECLRRQLTLSRVGFGRRHRPAPGHALLAASGCLVGVNGAVSRCNARPGPGGRSRKSATYAFHQTPALCLGVSGLGSDHICWRQRDFWPHCDAKVTIPPQEPVTFHPDSNGGRKHACSYHLRPCHHCHGWR